MSGQAWKAGHAVNYGNFKRNSQSIVQRTKQRFLDRKVWFWGYLRTLISIYVGIKPQSSARLPKMYEILILIYLTASGLSPGGSCTFHIYTQTIHRTTQNKQYIEQHKI